jgi:hypothetical protein
VAIVALRQHFNPNMTWNWQNRRRFLAKRKLTEGHIAQHHKKLSCSFLSKHNTRSKTISPAYSLLPFYLLKQECT